MKTIHVKSKLILCGLAAVLLGIVFVYTFATARYGGVWELIFV